jgi:hypothetical protein
MDAMQISTLGLFMPRPGVMLVTARKDKFTDISIAFHSMRKDMTGKPGRRKPRNHAGLYLAVRNEDLAVRNEAAHASRQYSTETIQHCLCWAALGTFFVELILLIK